MITVADFEEGLRSAEMLTTGRLEMVQARQEVIIIAIQAILREMEAE